jgi:hypothetical protein
MKTLFGGLAVCDFISPNITVRLAFIMALDP